MGRSPNHLGGRGLYTEGKQRTKLSVKKCGTGGAAQGPVAELIEDNWGTRRGRSDRDRQRFLGDPSEGG